MGRRNCIAVVVPSGSFTSLRAKRSTPWCRKWRRGLLRFARNDGGITAQHKIVIPGARRARLERAKVELKHQFGRE